MPPSDEFISEEEYLIREPQAEYKSEFRDGRMVSMAGAGLAHSLITANLIRHIGNQLDGKPCAVYTSDTRIKVAAAHFYTYPDLSIVCGSPIIDSKDPWALTNPTVIVEVLSQSTQAYDRGEKFEYYKKLPSLRDYVLVTQDRVLVERYSRVEGGQWSRVEYPSRDDVLELSAIGCRVALRHVYERVAELGK